MTTIAVRLTGYRGTRQHHQLVQLQLAGDISQSINQPYEWSQTINLTAGSSTAVSSVPVNSAQSPVRQTAFQRGAFQANAFQIFAAGLLGGGLTDVANFVTIEVPDGKAVRYEFNTVGRRGGSVTAGNTSPRAVGFNIFDWRPGTIVTFVDASVFP